ARGRCILKQVDWQPLLAQLAEQYRAHAPASAALQERGRAVLVDGGSHALRLIEPFPPRIAAAHGAYVWDEDGHQIVDLWQGHFANVLGHNPPQITAPVAAALADGWGLQTGFTDRGQIEAAEILCRQTGAERVRFTTSGALATMYAVLLARAYTGRDLVLKVGGGWHGGQPWGLKGAGFRPGEGFDHADTAGLPAAVDHETVLTRFNDPDRLADQFRAIGDRLACFIVEPYIGAGGGIPATREYLTLARELTAAHGVVLIADEVIAGFRFRAGDLTALYGVQPDLATFGKVIGGGMPVTAVAGRAEILNLAGRAGGSKVKFSGGTYSGHPAAMLAALTAMTYLAEHEQEVYPRLALLGALVRRAAEDAFAAEGIVARCTGSSPELSCGSSLGCLHFPFEADHPLLSPEDTLDPAVCDVVLSERVLKLALLLEDVHVEHGLGGLSTGHSAADLTRLAEAYGSAARRIKRYLECG
ncbi:MAG TPA: aminotransferase class III-fold pyridoxal phosphate-dependent enzyme, partial [Anaerolineae bacterium]